MIGVNEPPYPLAKIERFTLPRVTLRPVAGKQIVFTWRVENVFRADTFLWMVPEALHERLWLVSLSCGCWPQLKEHARVLLVKYKIPKHLDTLQCAMYLTAYTQHLAEMPPSALGLPAPP